jgi:lysozyme family protein
MQVTFDRFFKAAMEFEGTSYEDVPGDRGGPTRAGITYGRLAQVRGIRVPARGTPAYESLKDDLRHLSMDEIAAIYRSDYWDAVCGDRLPSGVDFACADFGLNSGPSRAVKYLQRLVGTPQTGRMDEATLSAVAEHNPADLITDYCDARARFLTQIVERDPSQMKFKKGWLNRVGEVRRTALRLADSQPSTPKMAKAELPDEATRPADLAPVSRKVETTKNGQTGAVAIIGTGGLIEAASLLPQATDQITAFQSFGAAVAGLSAFARDHMGLVLIVIGGLMFYHYRKQLWLMVDDFVSGRWLLSKK